MPPKKSKDLLRTYPLRGKAAVKLEPRKSLSKADTELLLKMYEATDLEALPADFLVLNGEVGKYGWQRVLQFAVYEKYNFFLPFLKLQLREKSFEELLEQGVLDDFLYVYCTMMTLMLNSSGGFYDPEQDEREYKAEYTNEQNREIGAFRRDIDTFRARLRAVLTPASTASRAASSGASSGASREGSSATDKGAMNTVFKYKFPPPEVKYERYDVSADGSCMFHAVYFGLKRTGQLPDAWSQSTYKIENGQDLRKKLVSKLKSKPWDEFKAYVCNGRCKENDDGGALNTKEKYLNWLSNPMNYTDEQEVALLSKYFSINIYLYQGEGQAHLSYGDRGPIVHIWYNGERNRGGHYNYLIRFVTIPDLLKGAEFVDRGSKMRSYPKSKNRYIITEKWNGTKFKAKIKVNGRRKINKNFKEKQFILLKEGQLKSESDFLLGKV
jgi:hypothetical protein